MGNLSRNNLNRISRRQLLKAGLAGAGAVGLSKLAAPSPATGAAPAGAGAAKALRFVWIGDINPLWHPAGYHTFSQAVVFQFIFNNLVRMDEELKNVVGDLAERWEVSPDARVFTFYLRKGVKWHDGQPFTAKDVVFSFSRQILEPYKFTVFMTAIRGAADYKAGRVDRVTGLEALDNNTVRITLENPNALFLNDLAEPGNVIIPEHLLKAVAPEKVLSDPFVTKSPVGTGAYKFTQWITDQYVEMDANPDYFKGKPKIDKVFMKRLLPSVAIAQLESGEVDLALRLNPLEYDRLAKVAALRVISRPGVGHVSMQYPCEQARWSDKRIRQAIAHAIDRKTIAQAVYNGRAEVINGAPPVLDQYKDLNQYEYNPEKAKQLAQAANFDTKAPLRIIYDQGYPLSPQYVPIVGQQLQKAGFNPQLEALDSTALIDRTTNKRDTWDIRFYYGGSWATSPQVPSQYFDCKRPGWTSGYLNCDLDNLFRQAQATVDPAKRSDIYHQIARIFNEDQPITFLWMPHDFHAATKNLGGTFSISKDAKNSFTRVEGWTLS